MTVEAPEKKLVGVKTDVAFVRECLFSIKEILRLAKTSVGFCRPDVKLSDEVLELLREEVVFMEQMVTKYSKEEQTDGTVGQAGSEVASKETEDAAGWEIPQ